MPAPEIARLELLAELDALAEDLRAWSEHAGDWDAARHCQALVRRLLERTDTIRLRLEAPLVVATLGGTGTGKSALVNALVGQNVSASSKQRPTTRNPRLILHPRLAPADLGIPADEVDVVHVESPLVRDLVLVDCPDPDTTEDREEAETNLARLRAILPHCDVLLVTATQQKYHSAQVSTELAAAAPGAKLVFVQTHADSDADVRDDWRRILAERHEVGDIFFVDSLAAFRDAQQGIQPRGEFARLVDLLTREFSHAAAHRIRRANFLNLVEHTLTACRDRLDRDLPAVERLSDIIVDRRGRIMAQMAGRMTNELLSSRRQWENRLLGEAASRWGFSPFALVLRTYQGLGGLIAGAALSRVRTPAQLAIWGVVRGGDFLRQKRSQSQAETGLRRAAAWGADEALLRASSIELTGYARDAGLRVAQSDVDLAGQVETLGESFTELAAAQIQEVIRETARRHTGWFTRFIYELLFCALLAALLYRLGRNFFWDAWLGYELGYLAEPKAMLGLDFFVVAGFWLLVWSGLLLFVFLWRLGGGLKARILALAQTWRDPRLAEDLFAPWSAAAGSAREFHAEAYRLSNRAADLRQRIETPA